ncbi:MAG: DUF4135 domain-containing protein, partial [Bdellovibrionales bacterium]|nr:DUF4135 domain-containing protein [Bdellovibrionales bacterium]
MATAVGVSARAGDIHNFRRHVVIALSDASRLVIKPRSAFWEWLFFGQNSPIRSALGDSFLAGKNGVFGLQVISCKPHLSQVVYLERQVPSTPKNPNLVQEFLYQYGGLLAYAYVFGIEDLHIENLVQRGNRLQVVDVEVVFGNLCLPNQTHLFPLGNLTWSQTGLGHLKVNSVFSEPINLESLLSGYLHASIQISEKSEKILSGLEPYRGELT